MVDEFEEMLRSVATLAYESLRHQPMSDRSYEKAMSAELTEREIIHETHKKVFDERKGKYRFIDLYFPEQQRFAKLKSRKYITRTEINELKEDEQIVGVDGMIINFYNGVIFRHTSSARTRGSDHEPINSLPIPSEQNRLKPSRMTLPHLTGSLGRLNDLTEPPTFRPHKLSLNGLTKAPLSVLPLHGEKEAYSNANRIFSLSCAAFFLAEGDRGEFATIFNDLLESMKFDRIDIPDQFLDGPRMTTPDGELADALKKALNIRRKSQSKKDKVQNSDRSSKAHSSDEHEQELHYIGFQSKDE